MLALPIWIAPQHTQLALKGGEPQNRIERGRLARAVGADQPQNPPLFHTQINSIQRDRRTKSLAESACLYACHGFSAPPLPAKLRARFPCPSAAHPLKAQAARWWPRSWATVRPEISGARPLTADRERRSSQTFPDLSFFQIGRASCRERV